jgi:hypothetical protein
VGVAGSETAHDWFERTFGAPLPFVIAEPLVQTPGKTHWSTVVSPELAPDSLVVPAFPETPASYTVLGHWGYGVGSQAFYFVRREGRHRCFLRVGLGGAYDPPERVAEIVAALSTYRALLEAPALSASELVYSIGTGHAELELEGGQVVAFDTWAAAAGPGAPAPRVDAFVRYVRERAQASGSMSSSG